MSQKNPGPVLEWAEKYINHPDTEIRREVCHGIELRGRTHPEDILPILKKLQFEKKSRVRKTLIHVLGQISYKKSCLETVVNELRNWEDTELILEAIEEILDVHERYGDFSYYSKEETECVVESILN